MPIEVQLFALDKDSSSCLTEKVRVDTLEELRQEVKDFDSKVTFRRYELDYVIDDSGNFSEDEVSAILDEP
jgi:hypothetical protein